MSRWRLHEVRGAGVWEILDEEGNLVASLHDCYPSTAERIFRLVAPTDRVPKDRIDELIAAFDDPEAPAPEDVFDDLEALARELRSLRDAKLDDRWSFVFRPRGTHTEVRVRVGTPGSRALAGKLVLREEEATDLVGALGGAKIAVETERGEPAPASTLFLEVVALAEVLDDPVVAASLIARAAARLWMRNGGSLDSYVEMARSQATAEGRS